MSEHVVENVRSSLRSNEGENERRFGMPGVPRDHRSDLASRVPTFSRSGSMKMVSSVICDSLQTRSIAPICIHDRFKKQHTNGRNYTEYCKLEHDEMIDEATLLRGQRNYS